MGQITEIIAEWIYKKQWRDVNPEDQASVIDSLVDTVGVALAGSRDGISKFVREYAFSTGRPGQSEIWGFTEMLAAGAAAFSNGTAAMSQEYDDRTKDRVGHPSCVLFPALIAVAQQESASGVAVLEGYVAGLGLGRTLGHLYGENLAPRGWHVTSVLGTVASAAGVAKMLDMSPAQIATTIGVAVSMAGGISGNFGSPTKAMHAGRAAQAGVDAALLARSGLTSAPGALDGEHGAIVAFGHGAGNSGSAETEEQLVALAEGAIPGLIRKQFPTFGETTLAIEAALDVRAKLPPDAVVARVSLRLAPAAHVELSLQNAPSNAIEARHSFPYVVSVALARGFPLPRYFSDAELFDEVTRQIMSVVQVESVSGMSAEGPDALDTPNRVRNFAEVVVETVDGQTYLASRSDPPRKISGEAVDQKFLTGAREVLPISETRALLDRLRLFPSVSSVGRLLRT